MSEEIKKVDSEVTESETPETPDDGEGYAYCDSHKQRCMNDCPGGTPFISHLN